LSKAGAGISEIGLQFIKIMAYTCSILLAVGLDLLLGDPSAWPHPVRAIGLAYARLDGLADRLGRRTRAFGALGVTLVAAASAGLVWLAGAIPWIGPVIGLYFAYAGLALGGLLGEARRAARFLDNGDQEAARAVVAGLVSRDVSALDAEGLSRALAESVAENANDGFVAPLFYLALGGPAVLWAYKAVSTADSMWGYRTARYERLGAFAARADDALAYLPARLTAGAMWLAAGLFGQRRWGLWENITRDAKKSASPNAGWPMAAAAWICGGSMGGRARYFGRDVEKPRLGPGEAPWTAGRQQVLRRLVFLSGIFVVALAIVVRMGFYYIFAM
jgi:adenosylcobinamide-phosphate synthase